MSIVGSLIGAGTSILTSGGSAGTGMVKESNTKADSTESLSQLLNSLVNQSSDSTTDQSTTTTGNETTVANTTGSQETTGNESSNTTGTQTTQNISSEQEAQLNAVLATLSNKAAAGGEDFSKSAAIGDANAAMQAAIDQVVASGIGDVANLGSNSGSYNSTVQQNAANELGVKATQAGQQTILDTIVKYGQLGQGQDAGMAGNIAELIKAAAAGGGTTTTDQTTDTTNSQNTNNTQQTATNTDTSNQSDTTSNTASESTTDTTQSTNQTTETEANTNTKNVNEVVGQSGDRLDDLGNWVGDTLGGSNGEKALNLMTGGASGVTKSAGKAIKSIGKSLGF